MRRPSVSLPIVLILALLISGVSGSVFAQSQKSLVDSLYSLSLNGKSEPTLQETFDSLGYEIDVENDEIGLEVFCARAGVNTVHLVVEYAQSARLAESGYYLAGDPRSRVRLFRGWNKPGDSAQFSLEGGPIGFYIEPNIPLERDYRWYTETRFNKDKRDHAKVFETGQQGEYLIAFEDVSEGGDNDYQDLVLRAQLGVPQPSLRMPSDFRIMLCPSNEVCFAITALAGDCAEEPFRLDMLSGEGVFVPVEVADSTTAEHCFTPMVSGKHTFVFKLSDGEFTIVDSVSIDVSLIGTPVCNLPNDTAFVLCTPEQVRIPIPDVNCIQTIGPGSIRSGYWEFTPTESETVTIGLSCANECGLYCEGTFTVTIELTVGQVARLEITPSGNITRAAGDTITFDVTAYDCADNGVSTSGLQFEFTQGSDIVGKFEGNSLIATAIGTAQVVATVGGISITTGVIAVTPGPLASMDLQIYPTQLVGHPLIHSAILYLYDAFGNPKTDFDLSSNPITLIPGGGALIPDIISDPALFVDGTVDILGAGVTYIGASGRITINASGGGVASGATDVTFNKYEITAVLDLTGSPIDRVYSDVPTTIRPVILNNGNLPGEPESRLWVTLASQAEGSESAFDPADPGIEDTLGVVLPPSGQQSGFDTLITIVETDFRINGMTYTIADTVFTPVTIVSTSPTANWSIVPGSFKPDTGFISMKISSQFEVLANGADDLIDSTYIRLSILRFVGDPNAIVLFDGTLPEIQVNNGRAVYAGLTGIIHDSIQLATSWYPVRVELLGYSNDQSFALENEYPDSIHIFQAIRVEPIPGSLTPSVAAPGIETEYSFVLEVITEVPLNVEGRASEFQMHAPADPHFRIAGGLHDIPAALVAGTYMVRTDAVVLPSTLLGDTVMVRIALRYQVPGQFFYTGINRSLTPGILVANQPVVKVLSLSAESPNTPYVNTQQVFTISGRVANVSSLGASDILLVLGTDGESVFGESQIIEAIPAGDTVLVLYAVTAASLADALETFTLQIAEGDYMVAYPGDNSASVIIQTPAALSLDWRLFGVQEGEVTSGQTFSLSVQLKNTGQSSVGDAYYRLTTPGQLFDAEPIIEGTLSDGELIVFDFTAPSLDTSGTFSFAVTQSIIDLNTLEPATIDDTGFSFDITVTMLAGGLVVEPAILSKDIVGKNTVARLFSLSLSNTSNVTDIAVTAITLDFSGERGGLIELADLLNVSETSFLENDNPISTATILGDQLILSFANLTLTPTQTHRITFEASITGSSISGFTVELDRDRIGAFFSDGPTLGSRAPIISSITDQLLVKESYTIRGGTLDDSFVIQDNPFDPTENPAIFSYALSRPSAIEFEVYSLIGERVYGLHLAAGLAGTSAGRHTLEWSGLNDEGRQVLNGVYVACLRALSLGEEARIKVAVVK